MYHRILNRMKITALIDDGLVDTVKKMTKGDTTTEALVIALEEWVAMKKLASLSAEVTNKPFRFKDKEFAKKSRETSRRRG